MCYVFRHGGIVAITCAMYLGMVALLQSHVMYLGMVTLLQSHVLRI